MSGGIFLLTQLREINLIAENWAMIQIKTHEFCQLGLGQRDTILNVNLGG